VTKEELNKIVSSRTQTTTFFIWCGRWWFQNIL